MSDDQSTERARPQKPWPIVAGVIGAVLLAGGVALALYSQFVAAPIPVPLDSYPETGDFPSRLVRGTLVLAGAVALVGVVVLRWGRRGDERAASVTAGAVLALLAVLFGGIVFAVTAHIPSTYQRLTSVFVVTTRVPSAIAALGLVTLGAVLVFGFVAKPAGSAPRRGAIVLAVLAGVVPVLGGTGVAVLLGDDSGAVDHVTAVRGPISDVPTTLGREKFRIQLPVEPDQGTRVLRTDTGFLVSTRAGITAYDGATGAERWHYRRLGVSSDTVGNLAAKTISLRGDGVVLTFWEKRGWLAFDADTGESLWADADFGNYRGFVVSGHLLASVTEDGRVTRYDPRSGHALWTTPAGPAECTTSKHSVVATMTAIYRAANCGTAVNVTELDPRSGDIRDQRGFLAPGLHLKTPVEIAVFDSGFAWVRCRFSVAETVVYLPPDQPLSSAVADSSRTNAEVRAADDAALVSSDDQGSAPAIWPGWADRWEVLTMAEGIDATEYDMRAPDGYSQHADAAALLADQVVILTGDYGYTVRVQDQGHTLRTWDRMTSHTGPSTPVTFGPGATTVRLTATAGSLLVITTDGDDRDIEIIGFG